MAEALRRIELYFGSEKLEQIINHTICIIGLGGVGGSLVLALARSGFKRLIIIDNDIVSESNINRQMVANYNTLNMLKTDALDKMIKEVNPSAEVITINQFINDDNICLLDKYTIDFMCDCIDSVASKLTILKYCYKRKIPLISSMGMGNRSDISKLKIMKLEQTIIDPLAKTLRLLARKEKIRWGRVVCSLEYPIKQTRIINPDGVTRKEKMPPSSLAHVVNGAGLMMAGYVINELASSK